MNRLIENGLDISVLIPTYNRAEILRETLEAMTRTNREGLSVEFIIIDNNSSDHTRQVVSALARRLPVRYLYEARAGKNCAINKALEEVDLGRIVVLTDDDVSPCRKWLQVIAGSVKRWPYHSVFGGGLKPIWPEGGPPAWADMPGATTIGLGAHFPYDVETPYPPGTGRPPGANYWVRRELFDEGRRYNEEIGPRPEKEIMGSEPSFLLPLKREGYEIVFCPGAWVGHRLQQELTEPRGILRRAFANGRGGPHVARICDPDAFANTGMLWTFRRCGALGWAIVRLAISLFHASPARRLQAALRPVGDIAWNVEALRIAREERTSGGRRGADPAKTTGA